MRSYKQNPYFIILAVLFFPIFSLVFLLILNSSNRIIPSPFPISFFVLLVTLLYFFFTYTKVYVSEKELLVKNRLGEKKINWDSLVSMSYYSGKGISYYQIKTNKDNVTFPPLSDSKDFEKQVEKLSHLEKDVDIQASSMPTLGPRLTRWKKIGKSYINTGALDSINNVNADLLTSMKLEVGNRSVPFFPILIIFFVLLAAFAIFRIMILHIIK